MEIEMRGVIVVEKKKPDTPLLWNSEACYFLDDIDGECTVFETMERADQTIRESRLAKSKKYIAIRCTMNFEAPEPVKTSKKKEVEEPVKVAGQPDGVLLTPSLWLKIEDYIEESIRYRLEQTGELKRRSLSSEIYKHVSGD